MISFGNNDTIYARATMMGREIANVQLLGVDSINDVLDGIRERVGKMMGIVTINIRNISQGWTSAGHYLLRA